MEVLQSVSHAGMSIEGISPSGKGWIDLAEKVELTWIGIRLEVSVTYQRVGFV